jgi:hypothetical protein
MRSVSKRRTVALAAVHNRALCKTSHHPLSSVLRFWDKTWDKTPFVPSPKMVESLAFLDAPKEPGDGFELSVPLGQATTSNRLLSVR